jgi:DNA-binding CsgD family transcriptional regulator
MRCSLTARAHRGRRIGRLGVHCGCNPASRRRPRCDRRAGSPIDSLTPHERRVLALVAEGRSNLGVAQALDCRVSSVEKHLSVVTDKLGLPAPGDPDRAGVNVRVLAVLSYLRAGR